MDIHSALSHALRILSAPGDALDSARERAAARLAPWVAASAKREQEASDDAAEAREYLYNAERDCERVRRERDDAVGVAEARSRHERKANETCLEMMREREALREERAALTHALTRVRGERDKALADAQRLAGEVERMGRAIAAALRDLDSIDDREVYEGKGRFHAARAALRSVAWGEPDAAEAEEPLRPLSEAQVRMVEYCRALDEDGNHPDEPAPVALTRKGVEACLRGEEIAALRAERDAMRSAVQRWALSSLARPAAGELYAAAKKVGWLP